jgi:septal ring factor EnvC (AmiA/AmiB activator)
MLEVRITHDRDSTAQYSSESDSAVWMNLVADVKRRLAAAESHCERLERELAECRSALTAERNARAETEKQDKELRRELDEVEASLADIAEVNNVGGRPKSGICAPSRSIPAQSSCVTTAASRNAAGCCRG